MLAMVVLVSLMQRSCAMLRSKVSQCIPPLASLDRPATIPREEYERILAEDGANPFGFGRLARSNAMVFSDRNIDRDDPALVQVVEELGNGANGKYADLSIAELAAGTLYRIDEYDGMESVMTQDDYAWKVA